MLPAESLQAVFDAAGVATDGPLVTSCGSGDHAMSRAQPTKGSATMAPSWLHRRQRRPQAAPKHPRYISRSCRLCCAGRPGPY